MSAVMRCGKPAGSSDKRHRLPPIELRRRSGTWRGRRGSSGPVRRCPHGADDGTDVARIRRFVNRSDVTTPGVHQVAALCDQFRSRIRAYDVVSDVMAQAKLLHGMRGMGIPIPMSPQCWGRAKAHHMGTVHHTSAPLRADAARPEMAQTPEGARHHPNDAHRDAMAGSSQCSIRAQRDATRRQRWRRPQRSPASSRASLLKTTQHATTTAPDRNQMKSRCMKWDKTEKPYRENRTGANGSQATPALEVGKSRRTGRGEYPVQTREQFETRTSAGRDSDALMGAEPLPAPPRHSRLRVPMMRRAVGGRACTAIPGSGSALARSGRRLTAGLLLAFAALLALLPEAQAQTTVKMVGNGTDGLTYSYLGTDSSGDYRELAQRFTTGSNAAGYTLSTAAIWFSTLPTNAADITNFVAAIYTNTSNRPGTVKYTLTNPSGNFATTGRKDFSAPADSTLDAGTKYWLVLMNDNATDGENVTVTSTESETDSSSLAGWSIQNQRYQRASRSGSWGVVCKPTADKDLRLREHRHQQRADL